MGGAEGTSLPAPPSWYRALQGTRRTHCLSKNILITKALPVCNTEPRHTSMVEHAPPCGKLFAAKAISLAGFFAVHQSTVYRRQNLGLAASRPIGCR